MKCTVHVFHCSIVKPASGLRLWLAHEHENSSTEDRACAFTAALRTKKLINLVQDATLGSFFPIGCNQKIELDDPLPLASCKRLPNCQPNVRILPIMISLPLARPPTCVFISSFSSYNLPPRRSLPHPQSPSAVLTSVPASVYRPSFFNIFLIKPCINPLPSLLLLPPPSPLLFVLFPPPASPLLIIARSQPVA